MVEELAEERRPRRVGRVVRVVRAQRQVDDQLPRARPPADPRRPAGRRACRARAAPPRPSASAARTPATGRSARNAPRRPTPDACAHGPRAAAGPAVATAPTGSSATAPALAPTAPRNRRRLRRCLSSAGIGAAASAGSEILAGRRGGGAVQGCLQLRSRTPRGRLRLRSPPNSSQGPSSARSRPRGAR